MAKTQSSSTQQPAHAATPTTRGSPAKDSSSTPKASGSPPRPASSGSATLKAAPAFHGMTPPSTSSRHSPPQRSEQPLARALFPSAPLHQKPSESSTMTVLQAFSAPLPPFELAADYAVELGTHKSSLTVAATEAPKFWTERPVAHYLSIADTHLAKAKVKNYLDGHSTPSLEPTFRVRREADVVTYASTHLTYAVNMALGGVIFPDEVEMLSEVQAGNTGSQLRPDSIWRTAPSRTANSFAILEMKITGGIKVDNLNEGQRADATATNVFSEENKMINSVKQLTAYARNVKFNTRYVAALFDGKYLLLCTFDQDAKTVPLMTGTLLPCHGNKGINTRKALLGWLIEAHNGSQAGGNRGLGPGPVMKKLPARPKPQGHPQVA
ncbi:hypothetical protein C8A05DRAFT_19987 [Staphylotrichum tortipilum]|uniref:Uncharacterized protein n=1 Tax=Staphylotrichum tortipilum TaxID=2831512 RepID=A0AAN6MAI8_9PEZI|nr:hypothetical protein C8A05DRAFT_19987 [Staphylotrichum longicolle]